MIQAILAGLAKGAGVVMVKLLTSFASESFMKWLFFYVAEQVVNSTKTEHDNIFLEKAKQAYEESERKGVADAA